MPDFTVAQRGTDSSGRPLLATAFFWQVWMAVLDDPRLAGFAWKVTSVQGAFMSRLGGGATASAGYHDLAGCWDVRVWNLTAAERQLLWDVAAEYGIWFWERGLSYVMGGMDPHGHAIAGWDAPLASGAAYQWTQAKAGRDGLAHNGPDYMRRAHPIVTFPPDRLLQEDYMSTTAAEQKLDRALSGIAELTDLVEGIDTGLGKLSTVERARWNASKRHKQTLVQQIGGVTDQLVEIANDIDADGKAVRAKVREVCARLMDALAADPDIDGPDNPAPEAIEASRTPKEEK